MQVVSDLAGVVIFDCEAAGGAAGGAGMEPAEPGAQDQAFLHWQAFIQSGIADLLRIRCSPAECEQIGCLLLARTGRQGSIPLRAMIHQCLDGQINQQVATALV